jgi:hypothetical protein
MVESAPTECLVMCVCRVDIRVFGRVIASMRFLIQEHRVEEEEKHQLLVLTLTVERCGHHRHLEQNRDNGVSKPSFWSDDSGVVKVGNSVAVPLRHFANVCLLRQFLGLFGTMNMNGE